MSDIHASAIVEDGASIGADVKIGAYCCIGPEVEFGDGVVLHPHVVIGGRTRIGAGTVIYPFASIGLSPQDLKYKGELSRLVIGENNVIREYVTMHPGTEGGGMLTEIGNDGLFMIGAHVAHDCKLGDNIVMANNATLAGHVAVGNYAIIGGLSAVHQFARIGHHAMIGGMSAVESDVIPYGSVVGDRARLNGLNIIGLKRNKFDRDTVHALRTAYRLLFAEEGTMAERVDDVAGMYADNEPVMDIVGFIGKDSSRGLCQPRPDRDS